MCLPFYIIRSGNELWDRGRGSGCPRGLLITPRPWLLLPAHTVTHSHEHADKQRSTGFLCFFFPGLIRVGAEESHSPEQHWAGCTWKANNCSTIFDIIVDSKDWTVDLTKQSDMYIFFLFYSKDKFSC